jgi:hypothetical protein
MIIKSGIPEYIQQKIQWVEDSERLNPLSFIEGGTTLVLLFKNGNVLGYDKIKYPSRYIHEILRSPSFRSIIDIYKDVDRVFVAYSHDLRFSEAWSKDSSVSLVASLQQYDSKIYKSVRTISQSDEDEYEGFHNSINDLADLCGYDPSYGVSQEDWIDSQLPDNY